MPERIRAIDAGDYQHFATQVAKEHRLNQQKIKAIYEQRRSGSWAAFKENSLSNDINNKPLSVLYDHQTNPKGNANKIIDKMPHSTIDNNITDDDVFNEADSIADDDAGLEFTVEKEVIIDGRLQVTAEAIGTYKLLQPWQAKLNPDLPVDSLVRINDLQRLSLPHYLLDQSHHPLGAVALIEAVLLCHQADMLSTTATYDLANIYCQLTSTFVATNESNNKNNQMLVIVSLMQIIPKLTFLKSLNA